MKSSAKKVPVSKVSPRKAMAMGMKKASGPKAKIAKKSSRSR